MEGFVVIEPLPHGGGFPVSWAGKGYCPDCITFAAQADLFIVRPAACDALSSELVEELNGATQ